MAILKDVDPTQSGAEKSFSNLTDDGIKAVEERLSAVTLISAPRKSETCADETMKDESISDNVPLPYKPASNKRSKKEKLVEESRKGK